MKKRTIFIGIFILFLVGVISIIGTYAIDSTITEGNSSTADYLFNITLGNRTNREVVIPSYDSKIVDIRISNPNEFAMSYLLYIEGVNSNISVINIKNTEARGVLASKTVAIIQIFIQNNSSSNITIKIKDIVGFEKETLTLPSNSTGINKGNYYKVVVKSNNNTYGKVKPNIKLSALNGILKYEIVPNTGYKYKSTTCNGSIANNILTISNITSNINCEVVFEPIEVTVSFDTAGGSYNISTTYTEAKEHTYTVPYSGTYKLEVWGAQGGTANSYRGGYGGYSVGSISLQKNTNIYVNVGGSGTGGYPNATRAGGYNGGGSTGTSSDSSTNRYVASGGGATHIATISGKLSTLSSNKDSILIVAGGGGGGYQHTASGYNGVGGSGGGYLGVNGTKGSSGGGGYGTGGSQTSGGSAYNNTSYGVAGFGYGGVVGSGLHGSSGGGGYYGGGGSLGGTGDSGNSSGGGGSGYIGNSLLTNKYMYCYNCSTSTAETTKTYTTTNVSSTPTANYAKSGSGAARITLLNADYTIAYTIAYGQKYSLPIPTKEGYTFSGWYTGENGTGTMITSDSIVSTVNNHTLYAYWTVPSKYTTSGNYTYTAPRDGLYKIELWGAQGGGTSSFPGGYGGYVSGSIMLHENDNLYVYVGENYNGYKNDFSYNGGGRGTVGTSGSKNYNGGGATDVRYFGTYQPTEDDLVWNSTIGLNSRIMVAGGGGGFTDWNNTGGGNAGGLTGGYGNRKVGSIVVSTGGTQISGGNATNNTTSTPRAGVFGVGGYNGTYAYEWAYEAGGGGGYYGGGSGGAISGSVGSGAGGSSYISGHTGCIAITSNSSRNPRTGTNNASCTTGTSDNLCSSHYSGKLFTDTIMIDGSGYAWTNDKGSLQQMPNPSGGYYASGVGHSGSGAAIITYLGQYTGSLEGNLTASKSYNNIITNIDAMSSSKIDHYEYYLGTSDTCPTEGYIISDSSSYTFDISEIGTYYVCAKVIDITGNILSLKSDAINFSRIYSVIIRYNVNGGTITPNTSGYTWTTDENGLIYQNGSLYEQVLRYGNPTDLVDYNSSEFINITKSEYLTQNGAEWVCSSGCKTAKKTYAQDVVYAVSDFCDITNENCIVELKVNWKINLPLPIFTYTGTYKIVDDNDNEITDVSTYIGDWKIRFLTDGTLIFTDLNGAKNGIDLFIVGGGGNGAQGSEYILNSRGGGGGGGGAAITVTKFPVEANVSYTIDIGAAKSNTSFKKGSTAYYTALAGSTPDRPSYTESGGWYVPIGAGGAGRLSGQTSKYGAASVIVKAGASGYSSAGNYEFNGSSGKRYGAGGGCGSNGIAQSAGGWADAGAAGGSNGGGKGGAGCSYVDQGSGYETVGGYSGSAATANTGSGGGGGGGHCGYSATSTGGSGYGGAGGTGIIIIRNTR